jgi:hypothetical protein
VPAYNEVIKREGTFALYQFTATSRWPFLLDLLFLRRGIILGVVRVLEQARHVVEHLGVVALVRVPDDQRFRRRYEFRAVGPAAALTLIEHPVRVVGLPDADDGVKVEQVARVLVNRGGQFRDGSCHYQTSPGTRMPETAFLQVGATILHFGPPCSDFTVDSIEQQTTRYIMAVFFLQAQNDVPEHFPVVALVTVMQQHSRQTGRRHAPVGNQCPHTASMCSSPQTRILVPSDSRTK